MDMIASTLRASALVSDDACHISREVFTSQQVYQWEKQHIFGKNWLYLCHDSQIPKPGDFITTYMGETPVIVARGADGNIHANINSCAHRGLPVCRSDQGNTKRFVCPYHNWSYTVEGDLAALPQERKVACKPDKSKLGLNKVPRIDDYCGLVFGSFNPEIQNLDSYLGNMKFYLDTYFSRFPGGVEVIGAPHKWLLDANWKLPVENQLGDVGHGPFLHGTLLADTPAQEEIESYGFNTVPEPGHGAAVRYLPEDYPPELNAWGYEGISTALNPEPELHEYLLDIQARVADSLSPAHARVNGLTFGVYPNFSFLWSNSTIRVSHPRAPGKVEYWSWWVVPKEAPDHIKAILQGNYTLMFGPGGLLEQEDSDAWMLQYKGSKLDYADKPYFYGLGAGEETTHPDLPGKVGSCYNEHYAREFYKRWRQDMENGGVQA